MANVVAEGAYPYCRLTDQPLSVDEVLAAVSGPEQGGIVIFVGNVRDHNAGHDVTRLFYEAYPPMVIRTLMSIIDGVKTRPRVSALLSRTGPVNCKSVMPRSLLARQLPTVRRHLTPRVCVSSCLSRKCRFGRRNSARPVLNGSAIDHESVSIGPARRPPGPHSLEREIRVR